MPNAYFRKLLSMVAVVLAVTVFFSGCSLFKKNIEIPAGHFFEEDLDLPPQAAAPGEEALPEEPTAELPIMYVKVTHDILNIRSGPGTKHDVVGQLYSGDVVGVLEITDEWLRISEGWIYRSYTAKYRENSDTGSNTTTQPEAKPTESTQPTDPADPTDNTESTESTEPTEVTENTEATEATEATENTEPTEEASDSAEE